MDAKTVDGEDGGEVQDHGMGECADSTVADADDVDELADVMGECADVADVVCEADGMECDFVLLDFLVLLLLTSLSGSRTGGSCFSMREPFFFPQKFCSQLQKNYSTHCSFAGMYIFIINQNYC